MLTETEKKKRLAFRRYLKRECNYLKEIAFEKNQHSIQSIIITIEWKSSKNWGSIPNASAQITYKSGKKETSKIFRSSGCGYDKESTVISDIFNTYLKYKLYIRLKKFSSYDGKKCLPYGIAIRKYKSYFNRNNEKIGARVYRSFEGGVGTDCYYKIAQSIGGIFEHITNGKTFDIFTYTDKSKY